MKRPHLSEEEIQQYLFDASACPSDMIAHMSDCQLCQKRAEEYVALSDQLRNIPVPVLDFDLSNSVMVQIEASSKKKSAFYYVMYTLCALCIALSVACLIYFHTVLIDIIKSHSIISIALIMSVAFAIGVGAIADMFRTYQRKINKLNQLRSLQHLSESAV